MVADDQYHTYALDLSSCPAYEGLITNLRFDPIFVGSDGDVRGHPGDILPPRRHAVPARVAGVAARRESFRPLYGENGSCDLLRPFSAFLALPSHGKTTPVPFSGPLFRSGPSPFPVRTPNLPRLTFRG